MPSRLARLTPVVLAAAALGAAPAAHAGPLNFADPVLLGTQPVSTVASATDAAGDAGLAAIRVGDPGAGGESLQLSTRAAGGAWRQDVVTSGQSEVRDQQVVVAGGRVITAWAQAKGNAQRLVIAAATPGVAPTVIRTFAIGNAYSASPRLARLKSGAVLLAFRDAHGSASAVKVARILPQPEEVASLRTVATRAASVALTAASYGATVAWSSPYAKGHDRTISARPLSSKGTPVGPPSVVTHAASPAVRLAGSNDGRVLASWIKPGHGTSSPAKAYTRSVTPARPARPLLPARTADTPRDPASIVLAPRGVGLAALASFSSGAEPDFGFSITEAASSEGGPWSDGVGLTAPNAMVGQPTATIATSGTQTVVWTQATDTPGPATYDVVVADRAPGATAPTTAIIGSGLKTTDGAGTATASAGNRLLVAWPAPQGGIEVAERAG